MLKTALISNCEKYCYYILRTNPEQTGCAYRLCFVMLNPSTVDGSVDDPTTRRCLDYMRSWGYGELIILNLYSYRATNYKDILAAEDPYGPKNEFWIKELLPTADMIVCAWGNNVTEAAVEKFLDISKDYTLHCLGTTNKGNPKHPLYLKKDLKPIL